MQAKVPLQLLDYEDKIIGPFTLKQFVFMALGAGMTVVVIFVFPRSLRFIGVVLAIPVLAIFGAFAFLKINDRSLDKYFLSAINIFAKPRKRVFIRETVFLGTSIPTAPKEKIVVVPQKEQFSKTRLEQLAKVMDTRGRTLERNVYVPSLPSMADRIVLPDEKITKEVIEAESLEDQASKRLLQLDRIITEAKIAVKEEAKHVPEKKIEVKKVVEPVVAALTPKPVIIEPVKPAEQLNLKKDDYRDIIAMAYEFVGKKESPQENEPVSK